MMDDQMKESGSTESKKEKVVKSFTKGSFLDMLKGSTSEKAKSEAKKPKVCIVLNLDPSSIYSIKSVGITHYAYQNYLYIHVSDLSFQIKIENEENTDQKPGWSILRDDFMMGADMKDWDKQESDSGQNSEDNTSESDSDR